MGPIFKTVQHWMERFQQQEMKLDQLMQPDRAEVANFLCERDKKYGMTKLQVPAVVQLQIEGDASLSAPMTVGEHTETLDSVPGKLPIPQVNYRPGSSHMRRGSRKAWKHKHIQSGLPDAAPDSSLCKQSNPVETVSLYPCIWSPKLIAI